MRLEQLNYKEQAPATGTALIYTRQNVIYENYNAIDQVAPLVGEHEILEIHLFDETKEYRAVVTQSARYRNGFIEHVADFSIEDAATVYVDTAAEENGDGSIAVYNHLVYEGGMVGIDNYRLMRKGGK